MNAYPSLVLLLLAAAAHAEGLAESPEGDIGYRTVADALTALRNRAGVQESTRGGWTIFSDTAAMTFWSFTPPGHPAYPSAVKRSVESKDGSAYLVMKVRCEASKSACDQLVLDFQQLSERAAKAAPASPSAVHSPTADSAAHGKERLSPEEINVTTDSAPGWVPSAVQRAKIPQVTAEFLAALDGGQYEKAFSLQADGRNALEPFERFAERVKTFNAQAGAVRQRRVVKITWTKDPAAAPSPGIYAAVDLESQFENIDRHCGYIVLYQPDASSPFLVVRQEENFMTNADARKIEKEQSPHAVDELWRRLARNCPNYASAQD
jgi:hypothetical protein